MKYDKVAYLCDGKACHKMCANLSTEERKNISCTHTIHEEHAKNKIRRNRKFKNVKGGLVEVE
ncbi:MAG: hypothetical protein J6Y02_21540 [Pseudobutyrivibrio sp.]|nr:hypothetical protein [Pseudobutyrivibrio sp.]